MIVYKHHLSKDFNSGKVLVNGGIGRGATVFIDYEDMLKYLKKDGRKWHVCRANVAVSDLIFNFKNKGMATIKKAYNAEDYRKLEDWG